MHIVKKMREEMRMMRCLQLEWGMKQMVSNKVWDSDKNEQCIVDEITLTRDIKQIAKNKCKECSENNTKQSSRI